MYLNYYGLQREPFHTTPDPSFLFLSPTHKEALGAIIYGIEKRKGFIAIIGEVGTGKTSILRAYLERKAPQKQKTIYIFNPVLSFHALLTAIFRSLEVIPRHDDVTEMVNQLHETLIAEYQAGGTVVLAIDEAQNMPMGTLENLRMLSNLETSTDKLIQIILLGQPELDSLLKKPSLRQFQQRIALWANICPLTEDESRAYIEHRIERASTTGSSLLFSQSSDVPSLFTKSALNMIARQGKGIPRRLNILCDNALITGFGRQCNPVSVSVAKEIIRDFGGTEVSSVSSSIKWAVGIAATIILFLSLIFFFGVSMKNGKIEIPSIANLADNQNSGGGFNSKGGASIEADPTRQNKNGGFRDEGRPSRAVARVDVRGASSQQKQSPVVSNLQSPEVSVPVDPGSEDPSVNFQKEDISNSGYVGTRTSATQKMKGSVHSGDVRHMPPVHSSDGTSASANAQEGRLEFEKRATLSLRGKRSNGSRAVRPGDSLSQIAADTYGSIEYLEWVKQHNPHIVNPDLILPGQRIALPRYGENEVSR